MRRTAWLAIGSALWGACAPTQDDTARDVARDDAGAEADAPPAGALVPLAPPVEVHTSADHVLGPVLLTTLSGSAAVIWGEQDADGAWTAPGFVVLDGAGAVSTATLHLPATGQGPVGLEPTTTRDQLAYFTVLHGTDCAATLQRSIVDTLGRITGAIATVDDLDDPVALHTASLSGSTLALAVEGGTCTARAFPAARAIVVGHDGTASGTVPLGDAWRVSALAARPDGAGYMTLRYVDGDGMLVDLLGPGGGRDRGWTIVRRDGTCECPSSRGVIATGGTDYLAAWAGAVDGVQSWFVHRGPYDDDLAFGADPVVAALAARFDREVAVAAFQGSYVIAYVPADGATPLRIDLLGPDGTLEQGWSPDVTGEVTHVAVAAIGAHVAAAWVEKWAGATAPSVLRAALFAEP